MTIQPTDLFLLNTSTGPTIAGNKKCQAQNLINHQAAKILVNRNGVTHKTSVSNILTKVLDDDLLLVNRGSNSYKVTGAEVKPLMGGLGTVSIEGPSATNAAVATVYTANMTDSNLTDLVYVWSATGSPTIANGNSQSATITWSGQSTYDVTCTVSSPSVGDVTSDTIQVSVGKPIMSGVMTGPTTVYQFNAYTYAVNVSPPSAKTGQGGGQFGQPGGNGYVWSATSDRQPPDTNVPNNFGGDPYAQSMTYSFQWTANYTITCSFTNNNFEPSLIHRSFAVTSITAPFLYDENEEQTPPVNVYTERLMPPITSEFTVINEGDIWVDELNNCQYTWDGTDWNQTYFWDGSEWILTYDFNGNGDEMSRNPNAPADIENLEEQPTNEKESS